MSGRRAEVILMLVLLSLVFGAAQAQWLETTITLPDTVSGVDMPNAVFHNPVNNTILVAGDAAYLLVIDATTREKLGVIPTGWPSEDYPQRHFCLNTQDNKIYFGAYDSLVILDAATNQPVRRLAIGEAIPVYNSEMNRVYCGSLLGPQVVVLDGATDSVINSFSADPDGLMDMVWSPHNNKLYCLSYEGTLRIFDCSNDSLLKTLDGWWYEVARLCVNPNYDKVYCSRFGGHLGQVAVIDGQSDTIAALVNYCGAEMVYSRVSDKLYCSALDDGAVQIIDGVTSELVKELPVNGGVSLRYCPEVNRVYFGSEVRGVMQLCALDCVTDTITATIPVGFDPDFAPITYDSVDRLLACVSIVLWNNLQFVDILLDSIVATIPTMPSSPSGLCYNSVSNKVYATDLWNCDVAAIDAAANQVLRSLPVVAPASSMAYNPSSNGLYVTGAIWDTAQTTVIDGAGDSIRARIYPGWQPSVMCVNAPGNRVYVVDGRTLRVIDSAADSVCDSIDLSIMGVPPTSLCFNPVYSRLYVGSYYHGPSWTIVVIDAARDSIIARVVTQSPAAQAILCDVSGAKYYVLTESEWPVRLLTMDVATNQVSASLDLPARGVRAWSYSPERNRLYLLVADDTSNALWVMDCAQDTIVATLPFPDTMTALLYNRMDDRLYCTARAGSVVIVDCASNGVIGNVAVGYGARAMVLNPVQNRVYVASPTSPRIWVLRNTAGVADRVQTASACPLLRLNSNPVRGALDVSLSLPGRGPATLRLYDVTGAVVFEQPAAREQVRIPDLAAGVYVLRLEALGCSEETKVVVLR